VNLSELQTFLLRVLDPCFNCLITFNSDFQVRWFDDQSIVELYSLNRILDMSCVKDDSVI